MKKLLFLSAFTFAGFINAKESKTEDHLDSKNENTEQKLTFKRYLITLRTICGTTHQTVLDTDFDNYECVVNEWEMHNQNDCGHTSYENPS